MEISHHVSCWAVLDAHFTIGNSIGDKVAYDIDMPGALAAGSPVIVFKLDGAFVVLVTDVVQKVSAPDHLR